MKLGKMNAEGGALFLMTIAEAFNVYGAMNSSPWTAENFGADEEKAHSCRKYVLKADVVNLVLGAGTSLLIDNWWPLIGMVAVTWYMHMQYEKALAKGKAAGSDGWINGN